MSASVLVQGIHGRLRGKAVACGCLTAQAGRPRPAECFLSAAVCGAAMLSLSLCLGIVGYVFLRGFGCLDLRFLTTAGSVLKGTAGIAGNLVNTLYIMALAFVFAAPVGVGGAVYLSEYAKPGRLVRLITLAVQVLAGIPSVIFGLFGMVFFGNVLGLGYSILSGALTLAVMALPLIVISSAEALRAVPEGYRSGALSMGAGRWHMIRTLLLPAARPGIGTGLILAFGRIVGESAALLFTAGSARQLPRLTGVLRADLWRLARKVREPGGSLSVELYLRALNGEYREAFGVGCVLILLALSASLAVRLSAHRTAEDPPGEEGRPSVHRAVRESGGDGGN